MRTAALHVHAMRSKDRAGADCVGNAFLLLVGKLPRGDELSLLTGGLALRGMSKSNERLPEALFCGRVVSDRTGGVGQMSCHSLSVSWLVIEFEGF